MHPETPSGHVRATGVREGLPMLERGSQCSISDPAIRARLPDVSDYRGRFENGMWESHVMPGNGMRAMGRCP